MPQGAEPGRCSPTLQHFVCVMWLDSDWVCSLGLLLPCLVWWLFSGVLIPLLGCQPQLSLSRRQKSRVLVQSWANWYKGSQEGTCKAFHSSGTTPGVVCLTLGRVGWADKDQPFPGCSEVLTERWRLSGGHRLASVMIRKQDEPCRG